MEIKGNVYKKTVKGKEYYSLQYRENGKMVTTNVSVAEAYDYAFRVAHKRHYEELMGHRFRSKTYFGAALYDFVQPAKDYRNRVLLEEVRAYLEKGVAGRVLVLYGLRRSGKTTMMMQAISEQPLNRFAKTAYLKVEKHEDYSALNEDLDFLFDHGIEWVFIDEITMMDDFISMASVYSDIYAMRGKVVLSGTDSLGFLFASRHELYDRAYFIHTSYIPFKEWSFVLNKDSIDEYIEFGGSMAREGVDYNKTIESEHGPINEYVDTAIAHNIIHSLRNYQDGNRFASLVELDRRGELVNVINRLVEDTNHRFAIETIERDFKSRDLGSLRQLLQKEKDQTLRSALSGIDVDQVTSALMEALDIINKEHQTYPVSETVLTELNTYLRLLDVTKGIKVVVAPSFHEYEKSTFIPLGLRYAQAKTLLDLLLSQDSVRVLPDAVKTFVKAKLLSDVKGRMLEEIVLQQTAFQHPDLDCFQYLAPLGEYDMAVVDGKAGYADVFEIKYSDGIYPGQAHFLLDQELAEAFEKHFYPIRKRMVVYRGETQNVDGVEYRNVCDYLRE